MGVMQIIAASDAWTLDRVARLKALHADGCSASSIAVTLGGISRMAVLGKIHRLGLSRPQMPKLPAKPYVEAPVRPRPAPDAAAELTHPDTGRTRINFDAPAPRPAHSRALALDDLSTGDCRWPSGDLRDGGLTFCGHRSHGNRPYCEAHCRMAYQRAKTSRPYAMAGQK